MKYQLSVALVILLLAGCSKPTDVNVSPVTDTPKNVILLIGDGMGLSQVSSAFFYKDESPNFARFRHIGLINTSSSKEKVTDSASGATAFSTGKKTYNGAIGVDDDSSSLETIAEILSRKDWSTGVIATSSITHATPASFYAHVPSRQMHEEIAMDLSKSEIDFFAGGGLRYFSKRKDGADLLTSMASEGFTLDTTSIKVGQTGEKLGYLLGQDALPPVMDGRGEFLKDASLYAIDFLSKKSENYFLMIEGSQIDWGGHANNSDYLISELLDFDETIGAILNRIDPEETLVVVTADHETGGFTLSAATMQNPQGGMYSDYSEIGPTFSTGGHSATLIPVFAYGKGAEEFAGIYENNDIFHKIMKVLGH